MNNLGKKVSDLGNKEIMAKNIQHYMDIYGVDRNTVCADLNIKYTTFTDWINAKTYPRIDKIELLANYFKIQKSDLVEEHKPASILRATGVKIPVLGDVAAGVPIEAIQHYIDEDDPDTWEEISEKQNRSGDYFALRIRGDSMEPRLSDGDIVIVKMQPDAENGDIVIAKVDHELATCKRLKKYDKGIALLSFNPAYEPMHFSMEDIKNIPVDIIGKVVEGRVKL